MIAINPARVRPQNRVETQSQKPVSMQSRRFIAPVRGLVTNQPLAAPMENSAVVLENFWPTNRSIVPRGGTKLRCNIPNAVKRLFEYQAGNKTVFFAADDENIYEFDSETPVGSTLSAVVTNQVSADYSTATMQTDGGSFLLAVNGFDKAQIFDGDDWQQLTDSSAPFDLTGVETSNLNHVWTYNNRVFFVEKATMNAWYLDVNSVAGVATKLPLSGVFNKGGSLLFGATWSSDSGSGMDDRCVFVTDQGELALFNGGNPADVNSWHLNGVYDIGEPIGKNAHIRVGGDLAISTKAGLIPLSAATNKDPSQLKLDALTLNIEPDWHYEIGITIAAGDWRLQKWDRMNMCVVAPPPTAARTNFCWALNMQTGAWTKFTGWNIGDIAVLGDVLFYGNSNGEIFQCDVGGTDNGQPFECKACFAFDDLGNPGHLKTTHAVRAFWMSSSDFGAKHQVAVDYNPKFGVPPSAVSGAQGLQSGWDVSHWDENYWASESGASKRYGYWGSASGQGVSLAPQIHLLSAQPSRLDCELVSFDLSYSTGGVMV